MSGIDKAPRGISPDPAHRAEGVEHLADAEVARTNEAQSPRELHCEDCDRDYPVWCAPNDLWNAVVRGPCDATGRTEPFLCLTCFAIRAELLGVRPTAWVVRPETEADFPRSETAGNAQACKHVDPLVLDGQRAWCWDCGALYGMSKWRLPKHGYSESELECAREAGRIEERAACLAIAEGFRQQYRSLRNQPDDPFQMNGWDAKAYAAWRIALRIEQRCGEAKNMGEANYCCEGNDCSCEGNEITEETLIALGLAKDGENELEMQDRWLATTPVRSTDSGRTE